MNDDLHTRLTYGTSAETIQDWADRSLQQSRLRRAPHYRRGQRWRRRVENAVLILLGAVLVAAMVIALAYLPV